MMKVVWEHTLGRWLGRRRGASLLERPRWAPVLLSGAIPRELPDLLAISILALASLEALYSQVLASEILGAIIVALLVPMTTALAALSNSAKREREELALFAYGGSPWQIRARHVLRGSIIVAMGLLPILAARLTVASAPATALIFILVLVIVGGFSYAAPGLRRTRSLDFVEQYKG